MGQALVGAGIVWFLMMRIGGFNPWTIAIVCALCFYVHSAMNSVAAAALPRAPENDSLLAPAFESIVQHRSAINALHTEVQRLGLQSREAQSLAAAVQVLEARSRQLQEGIVALNETCRQFIVLDNDRLKRIMELEAVAARYDLVPERLKMLEATVEAWTDRGGGECTSDDLTNASAD